MRKADATFVLYNSPSKRIIVICSEMRSTIFIFVIVLLFTSVIAQQTPYYVEFSKTFPGGGTNCKASGHDIIQDSIDNYFVFGGNSCLGSIGYGWFLKLNSQGNKVYEKKGPVGDGYAKMTKDGKFIHVKFQAVGGGIEIIKLQNDGTPVWAKNYSLRFCANKNYTRDVVETFDGGYLITGYYSQNNPCTGIIDYDAYAMKLDPGGNIQWTKTYSSVLDDQFYVVKQMPDSGFAFFGWTGYLMCGEKWFYLVRTDKVGNSLWSKKYSHTLGSPDYGFGMDLTGDGGFILTGYTLSGCGYSGLNNVFKLDENGSVEWNKRFYQNGGGVFTQIIQSSDGGYAYITIEQPVLNNPKNLIVGSFVKLDSAGNEVFKAYAPDTGVYFRKIKETNDSGFVVTGHSSPTYVGTNSSTDIIVMKYARIKPEPGPGGISVKPNSNSDTGTMSGINSNIGNSDLEIFPVPAEDYLNLKFNVDLNKEIDVFIFDSKGQICQRANFIAQSSNQVNISDLSPGIYFLRLTGLKSDLFKRIVVE